MDNNEISVNEPVKDFQTECYDFLFNTMFGKKE